MTFQLTAPLREPTFLFYLLIIQVNVSTHGSLAGADSMRAFCSWHDSCFNSRLPCGSRLRPLSWVVCKHFVSTHGSLAGADKSNVLFYLASIRFQLTAPLREPTIERVEKEVRRAFQLTAPLREPTLWLSIIHTHIMFQLTAPLREPTINRRI